MDIAGSSYRIYRPTFRFHSERLNEQQNRKGGQG
jgi:hypothetical protein